MQKSCYGWKNFKPENVREKFKVGTSEKILSMKNSNLELGEGENNFEIGNSPKKIECNSDSQKARGIVLRGSRRHRTAFYKQVK